MKFYNIALFVFLFNLALGLLNHLGLTSYQVPQESWELNTNITYTGSGVSGSTVYLLGDFVKALSWFIDAFAKATILLPHLIKSFGFPDIVAWTLSSAVWFVYIAGIIQFVSGRSFGVMQ